MGKSEYGRPVLVVMVRHLPDNETILCLSLLDMKAPLSVQIDGVLFSSFALEGVKVERPLRANVVKVGRVKKLLNASNVLRSNFRTPLPDGSIRFFIAAPEFLVSKGNFQHSSLG